MPMTHSPSVCFYGGYLKKRNASERDLFKKKNNSKNHCLEIYGGKKVTHLNLRLKTPQTKTKRNEKGKSHLFVFQLCEKKKAS